MTDFYGLPTRTLSNEHLRLEYLAEAGPRLVRLFLNGSTPERNLLAELPDARWPTPYGDYSVRGGHRLWHAPESNPRSYVPDDSGLTVLELPDGVELRQPVEAPTGLRKSLAIDLHPDRAALTLTHRITNEGSRPVETAPWAITQLRPGGLVILPQPAAQPHTVSVNPDRHLVLWSYTRANDPRLQLGDDYWWFHALPREAPFKFGCLDVHGWAGYLWEDVFFVKRFSPGVALTHPDRNCNVEVFCDAHVLELETLGPLSHLQTGETASHTETWEFFTGLRVSPTLEGVQELMQTVGLQPPPLA